MHLFKTFLARKENNSWIMCVGVHSFSFFSPLSSLKAIAGIYTLSAFVVVTLFNARHRRLKYTKLCNLRKYSVRI